MDLVQHTKTFTGLYECATVSDMIAMAPFHTGKGDYFYVVETNKFYYFARKALLGNDIYNFPVVTDIIFEKMSGFHFPTSINPAVDPQSVIIEDLAIDGTGEIVLLSGDKLDEESEKTFLAIFPKKVAYDENVGSVTVNLTLSKKPDFEPSVLVGKNLRWAGPAVFTKDFTGSLRKINDLEYTAELEFILPLHMETLESSSLVFEAELSNEQGDKKVSSDSTFMFEATLDQSRFRNNGFIATKAGSFYYKNAGRVTLPQGFMFLLGDDAEKITAIPDSWELKGPFADIGQMTYVEKLGLHHIECRVTGCDNAELSMTFDKRVAVHPFIAGARMKDLSFDFAQVPTAGTDPLFSAKLQLTVEHEFNHPGFRDLWVFPTSNPNEPWGDPHEYDMDGTADDLYRIISDPLIRPYGSTERFIASHPGEWFELQTRFQHDEYETIWTLDLYHQLQVIECRTDLDLAGESKLAIEALVHPSRPNELYIRDWFLKEGFYNKSLVQVLKTGFLDSPFADKDGKMVEMTKIVVLDKDYVHGTEISLTLPVGCIKDGLQYFNVVTVTLTPKVVYPDITCTYSPGERSLVFTPLIGTPYTNEYAVPVTFESVSGILNNLEFIHEEIPYGQVTNRQSVSLKLRVIDENLPASLIRPVLNFKVQDKEVSIPDQWAYFYHQGLGNTHIPQAVQFRKESSGTTSFAMLKNVLPSFLPSVVNLKMPLVGIVEAKVEEGTMFAVFHTDVPHGNLWTEPMGNGTYVLEITYPGLDNPIKGNVLKGPPIPPYGKNPGFELTSNPEDMEAVLSFQYLRMNDLAMDAHDVHVVDLNGNRGSVLNSGAVVHSTPVENSITPIERPYQPLLVSPVGLTGWFIESGQVFTHKPPLLAGWVHELVEGEWDHEYFQPWNVVYRNTETGEVVENTARNLVEIISYSVNGESNSPRVKFSQEGVRFTNPARVTPDEKVTVRAKFRAGTWEGEVKPTFVATITLTT
ncbi:hypothetical protein D6_0167 [Aeromonas phage D6]|uniref:Uncharacterized protein n=1 Tax=Aeromonas phage D6 TaxID=2593322 RepID=A0A7G7XLK2_9CAUD|nr:hypothetical protein PQC08_gp108 [Aeromonas phage D6]QNH80847.1 hypothetical protein D6_0167 [Aeromonas phage D6]